MQVDYAEDDPDIFYNSDYYKTVYTRFGWTGSNPTQAGAKFNYDTSLKYFYCYVPAGVVHENRNEAVTIRVANGSAAALRPPWQNYIGEIGLLVSTVFLDVEEPPQGAYFDPSYFDVPAPFATSQPPTELYTGASMNSRLGYTMALVATKHILIFESNGNNANYSEQYNTNDQTLSLVGRSMLICLVACGLGGMFDIKFRISVGAK